MATRRATVGEQLKSVAVRYQRRADRALNVRRRTDWFLRRLVDWRPLAGCERRGESQRRDQGIRRLEAVLFLAREPLSGRKLSQLANLADATEARTLVRQLNTLYDESGRAFRVEEVAGGFQLLTRPKFAKWLRRLEYVPNELRLSAPAMETLAVVAYRQPALRAEIEAVRGVNCGEILRQLMERDLVRIRGRSEELGRPYLYGTSKRFLQLFGLKSLDQLPLAGQMRDGAVGRVTADQDNGQIVSQANTSDSPGQTKEEESEVTTTNPEWSSEEAFEIPVGDVALVDPQNAIDDEDEFEDDEFDDDLDDYEDEDDYEEDDEYDEDVDEDEDEWEEVEDDEEEDDWDDDEDADWEDDEDDEDDWE